MQKPKNEYVLAFSGLAEGEHDFEYRLTQSFLDTCRPDNNQESVEDNFSDPAVHVKLHLLKTERMLKLDFTFEGEAMTPCDRCLRDIPFPVNHREEIIVKIVENPENEDADREDLWCVCEQDSELDLSPYFHETLVLARPLQYFCPDGEDGLPTCDSDMLAVYEKQQAAKEVSDPRWDALKALKDKLKS